MGLRCRGVLRQNAPAIFYAQFLPPHGRGAGFGIWHEQMIVSGPKRNFFNKVTFGRFGEFLAEQVFHVGEKTKMIKAALLPLSHWRR